MGAFLILQKLFSRSGFYDIACFSVLANGPHLDVTVTPENIFRSSTIDAIIFNFESLIWMLLLFYRIFSVCQGFRL